jgi:hypothetical protein
MDVSSHIGRDEIGEKGEICTRRGEKAIHAPAFTTAYRQYVGVLENRKVDCDCADYKDRGTS